MHLDSGGEAIDQDRNNAWMASDAGKAFLPSFADRWRKADVAAGEDPGVAEAMAKRTAEFYTSG